MLSYTPYLFFSNSHVKESIILGGCGQKIILYSPNLKKFSYLYSTIGKASAVKLSQIGPFDLTFRGKLRRGSQIFS